ncbi:MAG: hypothetical protein KC476_05505 [Cyanobacteria bacterium HKST-UBA06]|nr:hypothetical protein [Cyanobacteria bacterium HKST-UBA04]MCA9807394.1 hypothetical protein [Cyanobacteria bacterium HKST-UBA06]MCA9842324.1 hypothetical protein [Cyanobacteria bacterium HKST-UBA03]
MQQVRFRPLPGVVVGVASTMGVAMSVTMGVSAARLAKFNAGVRPIECL